MSDYEEDFGDFPSGYKEEIKRIIDWSISRRADITKKQQEGITTKNPPLFDGPPSWFKYEELIEDWMECSKKQKRGPAPKNRLVGEAEMYNGLLNRESLRATDGVKYFRNTLRPHFIKGAQNVEIPSVQTSKKRKFRNGQVDRQVFTVFAALKRRLDEQLADVLRERRTKTRSVSCRRGSGEC